MASDNRHPVWLTLLIIICVLPVFACPTLLGLVPAGDPTAKTMVWFYLIYVFATGYLSWICWPERKAVTFILLALLIMSHCAIWGLVIYEY